MIEFSICNSFSGIFKTQKSSSHHTDQGSQRTSCTRLPFSIKQEHVSRSASLNHQIIDSLEIWDSHFCFHIFLSQMSLIYSPFPPHKHWHGGYDETGPHFLKDADAFRREEIIYSRSHGSTGTYAFNQSTDTRANRRLSLLFSAMRECYMK
jgi:hypothetical protein